MEFILKLLGWRFASSGKKAEPLNEKFMAFGVELDFSNSCSGSIVVANKADRITDLVSLLGEIVHFTSWATELCAGAVLWLFIETGHGVLAKGDEAWVAGAV